jgi:hypothetical protein
VLLGACVSIWPLAHAAAHALQLLPLRKNSPSHAVHILAWSMVQSAPAAAVPELQVQVVAAQMLPLR